MNRLCRLVAPLIVAFGLFGPAASAQELEPIEGAPTASKGNPLYGYLATAFLGAGILFVLCKSSRR